MAIASSLSERRTYILEQDRDLPEDKQTRFFIKPLTGRIKARVLDATADLEDEALTPGSAMYQAVRFGIDGWENLCDRDGKEVKPEFVGRGNGKRLTESSIDRISRYMMELGGAVFEMNDLGGKDLGNSNASPDPSQTKKVSQRTDDAASTEISSKSMTQSDSSESDSSQHSGSTGNTEHSPNSEG